MKKIANTIHAVPLRQLDRLFAIGRNLKRAHDALRSDIEQPGEQQCNGESSHDHDDHPAHRRIRYLEKRKNLGGDLYQKPAGHGIRRADLVDVAALELGEE